MPLLPRLDEDVRALAAFAPSWTGSSVDLVVNNAGIGVGGGVVGETSLADWRRALDVNLWGVIYGCHVFAPQLRALGRGGIINVASAAAFTSAPRMSAYNVTKAGVVALSETLAAEFAGTGVTVTVLCPTFVSTKIVQNGRIEESAAHMATQAMRWVGASPDDVATTTLDAHAAGELYVLPQWDARVIWRAKRAMPRAYAKALGAIDRTTRQLARGG